MVISFGFFLWVCFFFYHVVDEVFRIRHLSRMAHEEERSLME